MSLHLDPEHMKSVSRILRRHGLGEDVFAFGSRVRVDHKKYSDLDLLIRRSKPLDTESLSLSGK